MGKVVNTLLFSPRFLTSRMQLPFQAILKGRATTNKVRIRAGTDMLKAFGGAVSSLWLAETALQAMGVDAEVGWGRDSGSDWLKLRVGDTRYDIWSGALPIARFIAEMTSETKYTLSGREQDLTGGGWGDPDKIDVASRFLVKKLAPGIGAVVAAFGDQDAIGRKPGQVASKAAGLVGWSVGEEEFQGRPYRIAATLGQSFVPLVFADIVSSMVDGDVSPEQAAASSAAALLGAGVAHFDR